MGSQKLSTWRDGHAHSRTWSSEADPARKLSGSNSSSGINCTAPSATPSPAIVNSQPPSFTNRTATARRGTRSGGRGFALAASDDSPDLVPLPPMQRPATSKRMRL